MLKITKDSYFLFSGGEVHCKIPEEGLNEETILLLDYSMNGLMCLAEYVEILRRNGVMHLSLVLPYLPYARQDREMVLLEPFSLKIYTHFIDEMGFESITCLDCHSDVGPALLGNCHLISQEELFMECVPETITSSGELIYVSPDAGAYKKVSKLCTDDSRIAIGVKHRDSEGKISGTNVYSSVDLKGKECIIVDDICDGGRTFIELAKVLKAKGASKVYLYVTHGIFSQGLKPLIEAGIDHIYTTNSMDHSKLEFLPHNFTITEIV